MGDHEETIIGLVQKETPHLGTVFCVEESALCTKKYLKNEL